MTKYLVDTCIWRDFYENRKNKAGKNIGSNASKFFLKAIRKKYMILFCESLVWELKKEYSFSEINVLLGLLTSQNMLKRIEIKKEEHLDAKNLSKERNLPFGDCITVILARNHKAKIVTRDKHFFKDLKDVADSVRPEEFI